MSIVIHRLLTDLFEGKLDAYDPIELDKLKYKFLCDLDDIYTENVLKTLSSDEEIKYFTKMCKNKQKTIVIDIFRKYTNVIETDVLKNVCKNINDWAVYLVVCESYRLQDDYDDSRGYYNYDVFYQVTLTIAPTIVNKKPKLYDATDIIETLIENLGDNFLSDKKIMNASFKKHISSMMTNLRFGDLRRMLKEDSISLVKRGSAINIRRYNIKDIVFCLKTKTPFHFPNSIGKIGFNKLLDFKKLIEEYIKDQETQKFIHRYTDLYAYMKLYFNMISEGSVFDNDIEKQKVLEEVGLMLYNVKPMRGFVIRLKNKHTNEYIFKEAVNFYKL